MIEIDCGTCPQLGRPRSHLGLVYAGTDQAGHDGNRFQTYDCLRRLTGSRRPPFRVLGHPEVGGIGVYMHENAASHVHDNTFEQCEASQKKKRSEASMCDMPYCPLRTSRPPAHPGLPEGFPRASRGLLMGKTLFRLLERTNRRVYPAFHRKSRHSAFANRLVHENNLLQSSAHRH